MRSQQSKREGYIEWDDYFMALALLSAERSKDPVTQVGACIVNENKVVIGLGYNGFPFGVSDDAFSWGKDKDDRLNDKKFYVCHAELNAILNKNTADAKGCTLYVVLFPCNECAKCIIQSGIRTVLYLRDDKCSKPRYEAAKMMFDAAGVQYRKYVPKVKEITLNFSSSGK